MISIVLSVLLAIIAMVAVAYPIVANRRQGDVPESARESLAELFAQRDAAFQALRELHFDHDVGKITDEDFAVFEANLKEVAATSLKRLDRWEAEAESELSFESQIAARKAALQRADRICPQCARPAAAEDRFCAACGTEIAGPAPEPVSAGLACSHCGAPIQEDDRFCPACGKALPAQVADPAIR